MTKSILIFFAALIFSTAIANAQVLDQFSTGGTLDVSIQDFNYAQSFTPSADGILSHLELELQKGGSTGPDTITVSIYASSGGAAIGSPLATSTPTFLPYGKQYHTFNFPGGVKLTGGTQYIIQENNPIPSLSVNWFFTNATNPYPLGTFIVSNNPQNNGADFNFKTYMCFTTYSTIYDTACHGNSYVFNGITQTVSGIYLDTLVNACGGDSIVSLNLHFKQKLLPIISSLTALPATICAGSNDSTVLRLSSTNAIVTSVSTVAGSVGISGNANGLGTAATFNYPSGVVVDTAGNIFVADRNNHVIRKITPTGLVSTFAGSGVSGSANGVGTNAQFNGPTAIALDREGNLIVADALSSLIRIVYPSGLVLTKSTTGLNNPTGVATDTAGNIYIADNWNHRIRKISPAGTNSTFAGSGVQGSADGTGLAATFNYPTGIVTDIAGNVYVSDYNTSLIRKITPGGVVTTLAGTGTQGSANGVGTAASFNLPKGLATDGDGNLYIADAYNHLIRKLSPNGVVTTLAGSGSQGSTNGMPLASSFNYPSGIASDALGNLYLADETNHLIRKIEIARPQTYTWLPAVNALSANQDTVSSTPTATTTYTVTATNEQGCISTSSITVTVSPTPSVTASAKNGSVCVGDADTLQATGANYYTWNGIATIGSDSVLNPAISGTYTVVGTDANGCTASSTASVTVYTIPSINSVTATPSSICIGDTTVLKVINPSNVTTTFAGSGVMGSTDGIGTAASFTAPRGIASDAMGNLYIAEPISNKIRKISPLGVVSTFAGSGNPDSTNGLGVGASFYQPSDVAIDTAGNAFVSDTYNNKIRKISTAGLVTTFAGSGNADTIDGIGALAGFNQPYGIATDIAGNVYVSDQGNHTIRKITPSGLVSTLAGQPFVSGDLDGQGTSARFNYPSCLEVDADGNVYVSDQGNHKIRKISPTGMVTTLAGSGVQGSLDGIGTAATFSYPGGLTFDSFGNLYVADIANHKIRQITPLGVVTTLAGSGIAGNTNGTGSAASFNFPSSIAADPSGNLFVTDFLNHIVRRIGKSTFSSYIWTPSANIQNTITTDSAKAYPTATTIYTVTVSNAGGCTATSTVTVANNSTGVLAQASSNNALSSSGITIKNYTQPDGSTHYYADENCNLIATVSDATGGNILGLTTAKVYVDTTLQAYNNQPYLRRHYEITPSSQGAAIVSLYLTQADFDDYNAGNGVFLDLPTGPNDAAGIANLRITQVHGNGVLGVGTPQVITPTLSWNAANNYWQVSFSVDSFSSFYFHSVNSNNIPLPISSLFFDGKKAPGVNVLNWTTEFEENNAYFTLQRSQDAITYTTIASLNSKAENDKTAHKLFYEVQDSDYKLGHNYYRLLHTDIDGKTTFESKLIDLYRDANLNVVNVHPNPTSSFLNVDVYMQYEENCVIKLADMSGRIIKVVQATGNKGLNSVQIDMSLVTTGVYMLQVLQDGQVISTHKVEKF